MEKHKIKKVDFIDKILRKWSQKMRTIDRKNGNFIKSVSQRQKTKRI